MGHGGADEREPFVRGPVPGVPAVRACGHCRGMASPSSSYELRFDSGRSSLDLLTTAHPDERLDSVGRLRAWLVGSGLVPADTPLRDADAAWLAAVHELRGHIGQLVRGELDGRPASAALERVNALARAAPPAPAPPAVPTARSPGTCTPTPAAASCSRPSPATRWSCLRTPSPAPVCAAARATAARSSTSTRPGVGAAAGAPVRCAATASGWRGTAAGRHSPGPEDPPKTSRTPF